MKLKEEKMIIKHHTFSHTELVEKLGIYGKLANIQLGTAKGDDKENTVTFITREDI